MNHGLFVELKELIALKHSLLDCDISMRASRGLHGERQTPLRGRGMEFAEVRHYQAGDEIRHMDWRVTARTGKPHIKLYEEERERPVFILCDFSDSMFFGTKGAYKSVLAARLSALIAWTAVKQGDKVGGLIYGSQQHQLFSPQRRESGILPFLASLSDHSKLRPKKSKPHGLYDALLRLHRIVKPASTIVLISDFYTLNNQCDVFINRLMRHNHLMAFPIFDTLELCPPKPGCYPITNGTANEVLNLFDSHTLHAYTTYCKMKQENLQAYFKRFCIHESMVTAAMDLPRLVHEQFIRRRRG